MYVLLQFNTHVLYIAHNHIVNDVRWSCDSSWLISACDDKTVRLWQRGQTEAVLTIATKLHNLAEGDGPKKDKVQYCYFLNKYTFFIFPETIKYYFKVMISFSGLTCHHKLLLVYECLIILHNFAGECTISKGD